ncbi:hypothetical protein [Roseomonas marmotae]|uniref:Uncharacterized protein n=1 Tax=Roseomonas marmotae TaxID=2768161 RepID=A0ABS3KHN9_9PROT|nr:hypothetical protein [Roseomonas marmotae]MBO1076947.1 hypothetical protein [Roseomonas marmotae]QTI82084.1 hypothetical protein IAI58_22145 [Roseomonas marmotae]
MPGFVGSCGCAFPQKVAAALTDPCLTMPPTLSWSISFCSILKHCFSQISDFYPRRILSAAFACSSRLTALAAAMKRCATSYTCRQSL